MDKEEIKKRLEEIVKALEDENSEEETETLEEEARSLTEQLKKIEKMESRKRIADNINSGLIEATKIAEDGEERKQMKEQVEERATALREKRSITVSSKTLLTPTHQAKEINDAFQPVSTLIDEVNMEQLDGGESYQEPYVKSYGKGGQTDESGNYVDAEPEFGYADINKVKVTAYAEMTEEAEKLPAQDYVSKVESNMDIAIKRKMVEFALNGTGTKSFVGIFKNEEEITGDTDVVISKIDETTLDEIVFSYGGVEAVEDGTLILSKEDLKAFSKVRTTDGKKVYDIDKKNKTIDTIPYVISSECHPVSADDKTAGTYNCMAYGSLKNYKVTLFSDLEIKKSTDYKFKEGITAYRGSVMAGGNTVKLDGFVRVKKVVA